MTEPKSITVEYRETVFLCANGAHESRAVYLWRGKWWCLPCLRSALRTAGANSVELYTVGRSALGRRSEYEVEAVRRSNGVERLTPKLERPPAARGSVPKRRKREWCWDCEHEHLPGECDWL